MIFPQVAMCRKGKRFFVKYTQPRLAGEAVWLGWKRCGKESEHGGGDESLFWKALALDCGESVTLSGLKELIGLG
jgi:hypothetical protein